MNRKECDSGYRMVQRGTGCSPAMRFGFHKACVRLFVVAAIVLASLCAPPASGAGIRLWPTAVTDRDVIRLRDVARLDGFGSEDGDRLGEVVVARSPQPGGRATVGLEDIRNELYAAGVNLAALLLKGASVCEISRPVPGRPQQAPQAADRQERPCRWPSDGQHVDRTLELAVRQRIEASLAHLGGRVQVRFSRASRQALGLSEPDYTFRIQSRSDRMLGLVSFDVDVVRDGASALTVPVVTEVSLIKRVIVARRAINRGAVVRAKDVAMAERQFTRLEDVGLTDLGAVVGQEARRFLDRGTLIGPRDVRPLPLVRRGRLVTVWNRSGPIVVKAVGKALDSGSYGQVVQVKNDRSGQTFYARVSGQQTVVVGKAPASISSPGEDSGQATALTSDGEAVTWAAGSGYAGGQPPEAR